MNLFAAYTGTAPARVDFQATVSSAPRYFYGSRTHCMHEAFDVHSAAGPLEVVDNVAIAPRLPGSGRRPHRGSRRDGARSGAARRSFIGRITIPATAIPTASSACAIGCTRNRAAAAAHLEEFRDRDETVTAPLERFDDQTRRFDVAAAVADVRRDVLPRADDAAVAVVQVDDRAVADVAEHARGDEWAPADTPNRWPAEPTT